MVLVTNDDTGVVSRYWRGVMPYLGLAAQVEFEIQRKLSLKLKLESSLPYLVSSALVPGTFNTGLIGSTCTAVPWSRGCSR